jgi:hypothetical protein
MLAIDTMPLSLSDKMAGMHGNKKIVFDFRRTPSTVAISLLYGEHASDKSDNTSSSPDDQDHSSCFSLWNSSVAYTHHRLMK